MFPTLYVAAQLCYVAMVNNVSTMRCHTEVIVVNDMPFKVCISYGAQAIVARQFNGGGYVVRSYKCLLRAPDQAT